MTISSLSGSAAPSFHSPSAGARVWAVSPPNLSVSSSATAWNSFRPSGLPLLSFSGNRTWIRYIAGHTANVKAPAFRRGRSLNPSSRLLLAARFRLALPVGRCHWLVFVLVFFVLFRSLDVDDGFGQLGELLVGLALLVERFLE